MFVRDDGNAAMTGIINTRAFVIRLKTNSRTIEQPGDRSGNERRCISCKRIAKPSLCMASNRYIRSREKETERERERERERELIGTVCSLRRRYRKVLVPLRVIALVSEFRGIAGIRERSFLISCPGCVRSRSSPLGETRGRGATWDYQG